MLMYDIDGAFSSIRITDLRTCMFNALNIKIELNYLIVQIKRFDFFFYIYRWLLDTTVSKFDYYTH